MEKAEDYQIIDAHAHIFPQKIAEKATASIGNFYGIPMNTCGISEKLIEAGKEIGVKRYLVCSTATVPHQVQAINSFIAEECRAHPEFFGLGTLHPDMEGMEDEVQRLKALGLHGIKLHPDFQEFNIDDSKAEEIYAAASRKDLSILVHMGDETRDFSHPRRLAAMAKKYPEVRFIAAHFGGYQQWEEAKKLLKMENIWFDTSSSLPFLTKEQALEIIQHYGEDRLFWGTDFPMWNHQKELERFFSLGLSKEVNQRILSQNFEEFFNIK